MNTDDN